MADGNGNGGLNISKVEFKRLPQNQKMDCIFENTEFIKKRLSKINIQQRIQWGALTVIFALITFIAGRVFL